MFESINRFTEEQIIGLNISDFSVEAVVLYKKRKSWRLVSFARYRLSPGIVENGEILQPDKFKEELKKMWSLAKPRAMKASSVFLSLPDTRTFSRLLSLPKTLRRKDLVAIAHNKAEEFIPEDKANLTPALKILPKNIGQIEVFYTAAQKGLLKEWIQIFEEMGLGIIGVTLESVSSHAALHANLKKEDTLLVDIGARTTTASIFDAQGIRDSINIGIAGNSITDALAKKLNISHTAAEEKKRQVGMDSSVDQGEVMLVIQGQLQPVADELKKFVNFYEESNGRQLKSLVLIGGTAQVKGLSKYFSGNLNLKILPLETILKGQKLPEHFQEVKYINALGLAKLAWEKEIDINFYQTERVDLQQRVNIKNLSLWAKVIFKHFKKIPKLFKYWYGWLAIVIMALVALGWFFKDPLLNRFSPNTKIITQEIIVGIEAEGLDNFIEGNIIGQPIFIKQNIPGVPYAAAVEIVHTQAGVMAQEKVTERVNNGLYIIDQAFSTNIISINPVEENFTVGDTLILRASHNFLSIQDAAVRQLVFVNLSAKEADKYSSWKLDSQNYDLLSFDETLEQFKLRVNLKFVRP